ncbi:mucin-binding protein [Lacticaseibacillus porcinae]|uniref:mucin-binding protein n=1 Tax=Lacticaseibacillus porcinae TaxID=1123687 RepID=UPI0013DE64AB|nr:MBG domain-containing protein [Lacticaseibacillus porcinae]
MLNQAKSKMLNATAEQRTHYKLYKSGRNWTIAGLTVLFSGVLLTQRPQVIHASESTAIGATETTEQSATPSATTTLQGNSAEQNTASADTSAVAAPVQTAPTPVPAPALAPVAEVTTVSGTIGNATKTYGGEADNPATVSVTLSDGAKAPVGWYYTGSNNTYLVNTKGKDLTLDADGMPGTSAITLSTSGLTALQAANPKASITAEDVTAGQLTINKQPVADRSITIADQSKTYDQDASTDPTTYHVTLPAEMTAPSAWSGDAVNGYDLTVGGDITVADTSSQTPGDYAVNLSDQALAALQAANPTLEITAASVAAAQFKIQAVGTLTVGTSVVDSTSTSLPSKISVAVTGGLQVPDDWGEWEYKSLDEITYEVPLTADNFDLNQVQLQTPGSYDIPLSDLVKTEIQNLNADVVLSDDLFGIGEIKVAQAATSSNIYKPSWMLATFDPNTVISGQAYNLTLDLYTLDGEEDGVQYSLYDGMTSYVILPSGFKVAEATGSNVESATPTAVLKSIIDNALAPSVASGFKGVTVTQLMDYKGRQTFQITVHTDGSNRIFDFSAMYSGTNSPSMLGKKFDVPVVIAAAPAGTKITLNGGKAALLPPRGSDDDVVYLTDDPSVTGGTYKLDFGVYFNVPSVSNALGVLDAVGLGVATLGPASKEIIVVNPAVIQPFTLVGPTGEIGTASYTGALDSTYNTADVVPNRIDNNGITYVLDKTQLSASDTLTPDTSQAVDTENMTVNAAMRTIAYQQVVNDESAIVVTGDSKLEDNDEGNPETYTVQLNDGLVAPTDWKKGSADNEYDVAVASGDIDQIPISQLPGHSKVTLSDAGLSKLAAVNAAYLFGREDVTTGELTINMGISVKYNYPEDTDTSGLPVARTVEMSPDLAEYTLGTTADSKTNVMIPMLDGYHATVTDEKGNTYPVTAEKAATITADGASHQYIVNYLQNATLTVQYLKLGDPAVALSSDKNPAIKAGEAYTTDALAIADYVLVKTSINGTASETVLNHVTGTAVDGNNTVIFYYAPRGHYEITTPTPADQPVDTQIINYPDDPEKPGFVKTPTTEVIAYVPGYTPKTTGKALTPIDPSDLTKGYHIPDIQDPSQNTVITYTRNAIEMSLGTVTKTVHYVNQAGDSIAEAFVAHANFTALIDPVTGKQSYGPTSATLGFQANPKIAGYTLVTSPAEATSDQTVQFGDQPLDYKVVYQVNPLVTNFDKVTKTVQYVDQDGKMLAKAFTAEANFTSTTDPVTGEKKYAPESATLGFQANPTIAGYTIVTSPAEATSDQTVQFGDGDLNYTVVYEKNPLVTNFDKVTKTVQYVDQAGKTLAKAFTAEANFTSTTDPVTGEKKYAPESATLGFQDNPKIAGYTVLTSPAEATSEQTVQFGDGDLNYTVVYEKNPLVTNFDKVTKTVQYVDQAGKTLAKAFTAEANFTSTTDPVTGEKKYAPESATLGFQDNPTIAGYTLVTSPAEATSEQTVQFDDADLNYTVVYEKNPLVTNFDKVTKTVQYVDQDGKTLAKAFTAEANFTSTTDPVTGEKKYAPESATLGFQENPTIAGYHVVTSPAEATSEQTVQFDEGDLNYTVVYEKNPLVTNFDKVTKTVQYVDQAGKTLAKAFTTEANFTSTTDPITGEKSYGPESATLGFQDNPTIKGYHVVTSPAEATSDQTVRFDDGDLNYTVVYNKNTPTMNLKTITKTVHYVDIFGNPLAKDFTTHVNFTKLTDGLTGEETFAPESGTLSYQANPTISGYHVVVNAPEATRAQTVSYGDDDLVYKVVYMRNSNVDIPIGGGETTPPENGGTTPTDNGGETTPTDNGGETTPTDNGGTTTPTDNGGTTTPTDNVGTTTPTNNGETTTPTGNGGTTTPAGNGGTTTPTDNVGTTTPTDNRGTTTPTDNGETTTPTDNGETTTPTGNGGTTTPADNGETTAPSGNSGQATPTATTPDRITLPNTDASIPSKPVVIASKRIPATPSAQNDIKPVAKHKALPQTGETASVLLTLLGAGMIALFTLGEIRRQRH